MLVSVIKFQYLFILNDDYLIYPNKRQLLIYSTRTLWIYVYNSTPLLIVSRYTFFFNYIKMLNCPKKGGRRLSGDLLIQVEMLNCVDMVYLINIIFVQVTTLFFCIAVSTFVVTLPYPIFTYLLNYRPELFVDVKKNTGVYLTKVTLIYSIHSKLHW